MRVIVCYDISDGKRLRKVAKILRRYGQRIEKSVFECEISLNEYQKMSTELNVVGTGMDLILAYSLPDHVLPDWICGKPPDSMGRYVRRQDFSEKEEIAALKNGKKVIY